MSRTVMVTGATSGIGGWLPDRPRVVRSVGGATAAPGSAVLRRLR